MSDIQAAADSYYESRFEDIEQMLRIRDKANELYHYRWAENMLERLQEMPLSIECEAIMPRQEECVWSITLGTGGPADRVMVTTNMQGDVESAEYQYQDWFQPWTPASNQESDVVAEFAQVFYFSPVSDLCDQMRGH